MIYFYCCENITRRYFFMLYAIIAAVIVVFLLLCIRIVPQTNEWVVEFLGKYYTTWKAGVHFYIPIFERIVKKTTIKEQVLDAPPQPVITKDNVTMQIDAVVFFRVFDSKMYIFLLVTAITSI